MDNGSGIEDLLNDDDGDDSLYELDNEREEALLGDEETEEEINNQEEEPDVLDLQEDENLFEKPVSDEEEADENNQRKEKFANERQQITALDSGTTSNNANTSFTPNQNRRPFNSGPVHRKFQGNNQRYGNMARQRPFQNVRGPRPDFRNRRNNTVLVNPQFKGVERVQNNVRPAWVPQNRAPRINPWISESHSTMPNNTAKITPLMKYDVGFNVPHSTSYPPPSYRPHSNQFRHPPPIVPYEPQPNIQVAFQAQIPDMSFRQRVIPNNQNYCNNNYNNFQEPYMTNTNQPPPFYNNNKPIHSVPSNLTYPNQPTQQGYNNYNVPSQSTPQSYRNYQPQVKRTYDESMNYSYNNNNKSSYQPGQRYNIQCHVNNVSETSGQKRPFQKTSYQNKPNYIPKVNNQPSTNTTVSEIAIVKPAPVQEPNISAVAKKEVVEEDEESRAYRLKIEAQKRKREAVLRQKEERRKLLAKQILETKSQETVCNEVAISKPINNKPPPVENVLNNRVVLIKTEPPRYSNNINIHCASSVNAFDNQQADVDADTEHLSTFLKDRKVLAKDTSLTSSRVVVVNKLSSNTSDKKMINICREIGDVQRLQRKRSQQQAIIHFKSVASAHAFYKKYQHYMLDLSMLEVTLLPLK